MLSDDQISNAVQRLSDGLRQARLKRQLTMDQLAQVSGINKSTLSRIENNLIAPSTESLVRLSRALDMSIDEFFRSERAETAESRSISPEDDGGIHVDQPNPLDRTTRSQELRRLNFLSRPSLTASYVRVTRATNVPNVPTRKSMEEHLVGLSGSVEVQYGTGLAHRLEAGEVIGIIGRQPFYKLKLRSAEPALLLKIRVPMLRDRLKARSDKASAPIDDPE